MVFWGWPKKQLVTPEKYRQWMKNPDIFILEVWGLAMQKEWEEFIKGKHITRQQAEIVNAVKDAVNGKWRNKISVRSGKGIGKSSIIAMLILWFLFCFKDCQIPCTAPTESHLNTVLWKEIALWLKRMPKYMQEVYEWTASFIRIKANPEVWFAMAKVGKKENAEAIAGIHADYILVVVDEASAVEEEIFGGLRWVFSSGNVIFLMISNPTRLTGYFYDSHCTWLSETFKCLHFSWIESPIVNNQLVNDIIARWGKDSEQYRIDVLGEFPKADVIDDKGYIRIVNDDDIHITNEDGKIGKYILGVDPAWEWEDETVWVIRNSVHARLVGREATSNGKTIAQKTITLMTEYGIEAENVVIDNFGVGVDCIQELAYMGYKVNSLYLWKESEDKYTFLNKRAELYRKLREWLKKWWELIQNKGWDELKNIKYRRTESNQIQIKPKRDMRKEWIKSPNVADALALTFGSELGVVTEIVSQSRISDIPEETSERVQRWIAKESQVDMPDRKFFEEYGVEWEF